MSLSLALKKAILEEASRYWGSGSVHHVACMSGQILADHVCPDGKHPAEKMSDADIMNLLGRLAVGLPLPRCEK